MKTIAKRIGIKVYNLKNGPFWKQGGAIVERLGHNIVLDCVKIRSHGKNNRVISNNRGWGTITSCKNSNKW